MVGVITELKERICLREGVLSDPGGFLVNAEGLKS